MSAAVYRFYDEAETLLYVGVTQQLPRRIHEHRYTEWRENISHIAVEWFKDHADALMAEQMAIIKEAPRHNVMVCDVPPNERDDITRRLTDDPFLTYTAVAEEYGVSRERIRQIVTPGLEQERTAARVQARREARLAARIRLALKENRRCQTCDSWILRGTTAITCSAECAKAYTILRSFDDPDYHRRKMAKTFLSDPGQYYESQLEWARRMLGPNPPKRNRTYLVPGSHRAEVIKKYRPEAYAQLIEESA